MLNTAGSVQWREPHLHPAHQRRQDSGGRDPHHATVTVPEERRPACPPIHLHCPGKGWMSCLAPSCLISTDFKITFILI